VLSTRYLVVGLVLAVLLVAAWGMGFVVGRTTHVTDESNASAATSGDGMDSMMSGGGMMGSQMGSLDENKPFDLQFIDWMIPHHEGALMSSEHMISEPERPELRELHEDIQKSQSEQIEQMQEWRKEWYPDAEQASGKMGDGQTGSMMGNGMMNGSMQGMMGATHSMPCFSR
jgi:hypothetical protein